jgi:hypothetical protein
MVAENLNVGLPVSRTATRDHAATRPWVTDHREGMASSIGRRNTVLMRGVVHVVEEGIDR